MKKPKRRQAEPKKHRPSVTLTGPSGEVMFQGTDREFKDAAHRARTKSRINTHKPNGGISESREAAPEPIPIGEAMRQAVQDLGDVVIDPGLAPTQLLELSECYEQIVREQAAFTAKHEAAKLAKQSLEAATEVLLLKIKKFTHPAPLPLFDAPQAEADRDAMVDPSHADAG